jgi:hypothetical protein
MCHARLPVPTAARRSSTRCVRLPILRSLAVARSDAQSASFRLLQGRNTVICYPSGFQFGGDNPMPEDFKAKCHIFYGSRSVDMPDGLPKWEGHKDGSKLIPESAQSEESVDCTVLLQFTHNPC